MSPTRSMCWERGVGNNTPNSCEANRDVTLGHLCDVVMSSVCAFFVVVVDFLCFSMENRYASTAHAHTFRDSLGVQRTPVRVVVCCERKAMNVVCLCGNVWCAWCNDVVSVCVCWSTCQRLRCAHCHLRIIQTICIQPLIRAELEYEIYYNLKQIKKKTITIASCSFNWQQI